ncbi:TonB-dependent receptor domain-containing protein [Blastomonas sp.]|uniref:TonB-dependent receptor domain-containing protein n=1 Tax=Blastomonas sp. TaxID=1909299 RepID=UPI003918FDB9
MALLFTIVVPGGIMLLAPQTARGQEAAGSRFDQSAMPLGAALRTAARTAGVQLAFDDRILGRRIAPALRGRFTIQQALRKLLSGTGLVVKRGQSGIFIIVAAPAALPPRVSPAIVDDTEIVVTARKREERAIDVPIALTAISGAAIERRGANGVSDVLQQAPGVGVYDTGNGFQKITIRGISTSLGANENGYYLDDLPFTGVTVPIAPDVRAWDLDRVEVLRGPQGTLFGEGSMGGTIRILTNGADLEDWETRGSAFVSNTEDGGTNRGIKAAFNAPIVPGTFGMRVAGTSERFPGWIDNAATGETNVNDQSVTTLRVKARLDPAQHLSITGSYWRYKGSFPGGGANGNDDGEQPQTLMLKNVSQYRIVGATARYDLGSAKAFYSYSSNRFNLGQSGRLLDGTLDSRIRIAVDAHELRMASSGDSPLQWTVGGYARNAARNDDLVFALFGIENEVEVTSKARALFGEGTYRLPAASVDFTVGLRYYHERLRGSDVSSGVFTPKPGDTYESWNPRVSVAWHPTSDSILYASAAKGFRAGQLQPTISLALARPLGIDLPAALAQDSIWSYEIGGKAELFDRMLTLEGALYYSDWKDVAVRIPIGDTGFNGLVNSKGTTTTGAELSVVLRPLTGLTLVASGSYVDATYAGAVPGTGIVDGAVVDDVAKFTANASIDFRAALASGLDGFARIGWQHATPRRFVAFPGYLPGDTIDRVDARIGVDIDQLSIALFADNLTDDRGAASYQNVIEVEAGRDTFSARLRPRTIGIELSFRYGAGALRRQ